MIALLCFLLTLLTSPFKSKSRLENAALRHQVIVPQRRVSGSRPTHEWGSLVLGHAVSLGGLPASTPVFRDRRLGDLESEHQKLTVDPGRAASQRVLLSAE
jgi:cytochrome c biogenesis protein CcdA